MVGVVGFEPTTTCSVYIQLFAWWVPQGSAVGLPVSGVRGMLGSALGVWLVVQDRGRMSGFFTGVTPDGGGHRADYGADGDEGRRARRVAPYRDGDRCADSGQCDEGN